MAQQVGKIISRNSTRHQIYIHFLIHIMFNFSQKYLLSLCTSFDKETNYCAGEHLLRLSLSIMIVKLVSLGRFQKIERSFTTAVHVFGRYFFRRKFRSPPPRDREWPFSREQNRRALADRADGPNCKFWWWDSTGKVVKTLATSHPWMTSPDPWWRSKENFERTWVWPLAFTSTTVPGKTNIAPIKRLGEIFTNTYAIMHHHKAWFCRNMLLCGTEKKE